MLTKEDLQAIGNLINQKIEPVNKRLYGLEQGQKRIEQKLDREVHDLAERTQEILIKLDDLPRRVEALEDHTGIHRQGSNELDTSLLA